MYKLVKRMLLSAAVGAMGLAGAAHAQTTPLIGGFYGGIAAVYTDVDGASSGSGFGTHIYGGLDLFSLTPLLRVGLELGHHRTGDTDIGRINNLSASVMATFTLVPIFDVHARIGYEDGDTHGVYQALGVTFHSAPLLGLRAEYARHNGFDGISLGLRIRIP